MNEKQPVETRDSAVRQSDQAEQERVLRPPVDIFEDSNGITLLADMPGVSRERLDITVDDDKLLIEGEAKIEMPEAMEALHADVRATRYRRSFALSSELATENVEASLKDGVLNLRIPKRAELRPRKIEVRAG